MRKKLFGSMAIAVLFLALSLSAFAVEKTVGIYIKSELKHSWAYLRPEKLEIVRGGEVTWINFSSVPVYVQFAEELPGHKLIQRGETIRRRFEQPGEHKYFVRIFGTEERMLTGSIVVLADQPTPQSQGERLRRLFPEFRITDEGVIDTGGG